VETGLVVVVVFHELFARRLPAFVGKEGEHDAPNDNGDLADEAHAANARSTKEQVDEGKQFPQADRLSTVAVGLGDAGSVGFLHPIECVMLPRVHGRHLIN
jgi:hypothetical protein